MNVDQKRKILIKANIIARDEEVKALDEGDDYFTDVTELEDFFQTYLNNYYRFTNPVFVFGSEPTLNAWAWSKNEINAVCINYESSKQMRQFFDKFIDQINSLIEKFSIQNSFDNGLPTNKIMRQVSEMFLFYHETGHLIQSQEPILQNKFTEEEIKNGAFDIIDHVSELDADLYACRRLVTHLLLISGREQNQPNKAKYLEDLVIVTIIGYMIYRLIINKGDSDFYLRAHSHPHMAIRMTHAIIHLTQATKDNAEITIDEKRIVVTAMTFLERLGEQLPEYVAFQKFVEEGRENFRDIHEYLNDLQRLVINNPATAHNKTNNPENEII